MYVQSKCVHTKAKNTGAHYPITTTKILIKLWKRVKKTCNYLEIFFKISKKL